LGGKLGNAIATEYGAKTVGDMLWVHVSKLNLFQLIGQFSSVSLEELQRRFGEESIWVYNILRVSFAFRVSCYKLIVVQGIDHTEGGPCFSYYLDQG